RASLGIPPDEPVVVCVARFAPIKDHPTLVRGFAHTLRRVPRARLLLVGGGEGEAMLRALVQDLGLTERVTFAGVRHDVPDLLAPSDLFSMASKSDGTSVTPLQAMV